MLCPNRDKAISEAINLFRLTSWKPEDKSFINVNLQLTAIENIYYQQPCRLIQRCGAHYFIDWLKFKIFLNHFQANEKKQIN